jgi:hypothetical protein
MARALHSAFVMSSICSSGPLPVSVQQPSTPAFFLGVRSSDAFFGADFLSRDFFAEAFFERFFLEDALVAGARFFEMFF